MSGGGLREAVGRKGSFGQSMKAVAWSFFGVRRAGSLESDVNRLNPVHLVIAGLLSAAIFVGVLIVVVHLVVS